MLCFIDIEHESFLQDMQNWHTHLSYILDVKLKLEALSRQPCIIQRYTDVTRQRLHEWGVQALLISGNGAEWSDYDEAALAQLYEIIREAAWPMLGFCGGLQLMAMAYGASLGPMRPLREGEVDITTLSGPGYLKEWGYMPVEVVQTDPLLQDLEDAPVFLEVHYWEVKELPPGFEILASTADCPIQIMKQIDKPVYGVQFHPEGYTEYPNDQRNTLVNLVYPEGHAHAQPDGKKLLENFFDLAGL